jgi:uncharacterized protein YoaH (UPF0181 family)
VSHVCRFTFAEPRAAAKAVERIQELMANGMSSGEAIALVASELRATHTGDRIVAL